MIVRLSVNDYEKSNKADWDSQWCNCEFSLGFENQLIFYESIGSLLLSCEIENLESKLTQLLNDELDEAYKLECLEPDFQFILQPKRDLRNDPNIVYVQKGHEIADIAMEWRVFLWIGGFATDNYFALALGRKEINPAARFPSRRSDRVNDDQPRFSAARLPGRLFHASRSR